MNPSFFDSELFRWVILPLLIFGARIMDVSIGTIRIIFVSKGEKFLAPILGFFESLIWVLAIGQLMQNLSNVVCYVAYAGGFAMGNYVGMYIEERLAMGFLVIRVITAKDGRGLLKGFAAAGFGATVVDAEGANGRVSLVYSLIRRKDLSDAVKVINEFDARAFYSIEDARVAFKGIFPPERLTYKRNPLSLLRTRRKVK